MDHMVVPSVKVSFLPHYPVSQLFLSELQCTSKLRSVLVFPDVLAKFPPMSVKMKQPFCMQPWDSLVMVKKLFKVHKVLD